MCNNLFCEEMWFWEEPVMTIDLNVLQNALDVGNFEWDLEFKTRVGLMQLLHAWNL